MKLLARHTFLPRSLTLHTLFRSPKRGLCKARGVCSGALGAVNECEIGFSALSTHSKPREKHAGEARVHAISTRLFDEVAFMNNEQI
eukprot:scaffold260032_cov33-Tisochrysis_lutea.AAC.1